jgi:pimeloyl-ACP methyl ester carboxylesterase
MDEERERRPQQATADAELEEAVRRAAAAPPGDYAKAPIAADVLGLLDAEQLDRVRLIWHDWGGHANFRGPLLYGYDRSLPPERAAPVAVPAGPAKPVPRPESCMRTFGTHTVDTRAREAATSAYAAGVGSR